MMFIINPQVLLNSLKLLLNHFLSLKANRGERGPTSKHRRPGSQGGSSIKAEGYVTGPAGRDYKPILYIKEKANQRSEVGFIYSTLILLSSLCLLSYLRQHFTIPQSFPFTLVLFCFKLRLIHSQLKNMRLLRAFSICLLSRLTLFCEICIPTKFQYLSLYNVYWTIHSSSSSTVRSFHKLT